VNLDVTERYAGERPVRAFGYFAELSEYEANTRAPIFRKSARP
jgi:hypothetical protein